MTLSPATASVEAGGTSTFTAQVAPADATDQTGKWATSDTTKATVAGGVVTAKDGATGDVDVTYTTTDGSFVGTAKLMITAPAQESDAS